MCVLAFLCVNVEKNNVAKAVHKSIHKKEQSIDRKHLFFMIYNLLINKMKKIVDNKNRK